MVWTPFTCDVALTITYIHSTVEQSSGSPDLGQDYQSPPKAAANLEPSAHDRQRVSTARRGEQDTLLSDGIREILGLLPPYYLAFWPRLDFSVSCGDRRMRILHGDTSLSCVTTVDMT